MADDPTPREAEEPSPGARPPKSPDPGGPGVSGWIINDTEKTERDRVPSDHAARRQLAVIVVVTMCVATIILEVALLLRGADTAEVITGLTPLTALASAVATFFFTREK